MNGYVKTRNRRNVATDVLQLTRYALYVASERMPAELVTYRTLSAQIREWTWLHKPLPDDAPDDIRDIVLHYCSQVRYEHDGPGEWMGRMPNLDHMERAADIVLKPYRKPGMPLHAPNPMPKPNAPPTPDAELLIRWSVCRDLDNRRESELRHPTHRRLPSEIWWKWQAPGMARNAGCMTLAYSDQDPAQYRDDPDVDADLNERRRESHAMLHRDARFHAAIRRARVAKQLPVGMISAARQLLATLPKPCPVDAIAAAVGWEPVA